MMRTKEREDGGRGGVLENGPPVGRDTFTEGLRGSTAFPICILSLSFIKCLCKTRSASSGCVFYFSLPFDTSMRLSTLLMVVQKSCMQECHQCQHLHYWFLFGQFTLQLCFPPSSFWSTGYLLLRVLHETSTPKKTPEIKADAVLH